VVDDKILTFDYRQDWQVFADRETSSEWDAAGRATGGPMSGVELTRLNTRRSFWFSIAIALPGVDVYTPLSEPLLRLSHAFGAIGFS
jgi:hypothetical protein